MTNGSPTVVVHARSGPRPQLVIAEVFEVVVALQGS
jgi:hypothetical protein